jgi:hypothetical protein
MTKELLVVMVASVLLLSVFIVLVAVFIFDSYVAKISMESRANAYILKSVTCFLFGIAAMFGLQLSEHSVIDLMLWIMMGVFPLLGGIFFWMFLSFRLSERLKFEDQ